jgi:ribosomal protein S18 acetylase RimI-like enzyme
METPPGITIRPAAPADAEAIAVIVRAIARHVGKEHEARAGAADFRRYGFGRRPAFSALLAERAGTIVGLSLHYPTFSTWRGRPGAYIQDLWVDPALRGGGLGRALVAATARAAEAAGADHLILAVDGANAARGFYRRLGFAELAEERLQIVRDGAFTSLARGTPTPAGG